MKGPGERSLISSIGGLWSAFFVFVFVLFGPRTTRAWDYSSVGMVRTQLDTVAFCETVFLNTGTLKPDPLLSICGGEKQRVKRETWNVWHCLLSFEVDSLEEWWRSTIVL